MEAARIKASALHRGLAAKGADCWSPSSLVSALARNEGVRIIPVPKDDPRLEGAEGVWDPESRFVYQLKSGDAFKDAFVAAHELGHAVIGGSSTKAFSRTIDPARAAEDPEIGADRIWDYSRRERKEVTMDLFAREFLMPRSWLRALYMDRQMSVREIASRLGAPFDVVAQQMLDALLLPLPGVVSAQEGPAAGLDASQRTAATHGGSAFLLEAGPGTGKTRTLVARIEHLLDTGARAEEILVLTFSNRAAAELTERIARSRPVEAAAMWIGTFHSFGLDLIRRCNEQLGLPSSPQLLDLSSALDLIEAEFPRLPLSHYRDLYDPTDHIVGLLRAVSRAKDEVVSPTRYRELAAATALRDAEEGAKAHEAALFYEAYGGLKARAGAVDFGDLVYLPVTLLESNEEVLATLKNRHRHILVDEYQDVNHASVRLLAALAGNGENLWTVGDARQSIYRFRGASPANMDIFRRMFPGAESGCLEVNYRSTGPIVAMFNGFSRGMGIGSRAGPSARADAEGPPPELQVCGDEHDEIEAIAASARAMQAAGHAWRDQAILVKGNDRLAEVARGLEARGVPVLFLGVLFEREEIRHLLSLLSLAHDRHGAALARLAATPDFRMPISDVMDVIDRLKSCDEARRTWAGAGLPSDGLSTAAQSALARLNAIFDDAGGPLTPWLVCARAVLEQTNIARRIAASDSMADCSRGIAIWQFLNYARLHKAKTPWPTTADFLQRIRRIVRVADERDLRRLPPSAEHIDAVRMMTIHGAKGLEFDVVHLPGLHARGMPGNSLKPHCTPPDGMVIGSDGLSGKDVIKDGQEDEAKCLFYVALSRAKRRLLMYRRSKSANASRYLDGLASLYRERSVVPTTGLVERTVESAYGVRFETGIAITASKLATYERCPRRFYYTHVLKLGGRREETPYTRMHDAVQHLVNQCRDRRAETAIDRPRFDDLFEEAWNDKGPTDHGYADDYRGMARGLAETLWSHVGGRPRHDSGSIDLRLGCGAIRVEYDEASHDPDGVLHLMRIRTGKSSKSDLEHLDNRLARLATDRLGSQVRFSLVNLADGAVREMPKATDSDRVKAESALAGIAGGRFSQKVESRTCPKCPHYFLCGPSAAGNFVMRL